MSPSDPHQESPRILVYTYGGSYVSGIDSYLLEVYRAMDKAAVQFDLLYRYQIPYPPEVVAELEQMGARLSALGVNEDASPIVRQWQELRLLRSFMRNARYRVIEINMTALFMCLSMLMASSGTPVRIVHAHDSVPHEPLLKRLLKRTFTPVLNAMTTDRWACSRGAAEYLFSSEVAKQGKWSLIPNAINAQRFAFDRAARARIRASWGVDDDAVCLGIVGRFTHQKNQAAGVRAFAAALKQSPGLRLVLVGDGDLRPSVEHQVDSMGLSDKVLFLGERQDMPDILSGLDVILAPSRHEGYPIIALEAQASGLPLIVSEAFPPETDITGRVRFLPTEASDAEWAEAIGQAQPMSDRAAGVAAVEAAGYGRASAARNLEARYWEAWTRAHGGVPQSPDRRPQVTGSEVMPWRAP